MKIASTVTLTLLSTLSTCESLGPGCVPLFATGDDASSEPDESSTADPASSDSSSTLQLDLTDPPAETSSGESSSTGEKIGLTSDAADTSTSSPPPDKSSSTDTAGISGTTSSSDTDWSASDTDWSASDTGYYYPWCGNGMLDDGEECDDGNKLHYDECSNECHDNTASGCSPMLPTVKCDAGLYCIAPGVCGGCPGLPDIGSSCGAIDPERPACDPVGQTCVECTPEDEQACVDNQPYCNKYTLECGGCLVHEQCAAGICNSGACMPPETIAWVQQQPGCAAKDGSESAPFCTIAEALAAPQWSGGPLGIRVLHGTLPQPALPPIAGRTVAIVGFPDEEGNFPRISDPMSTNAITSISGGGLFLSRLRIDASTATPAAVKCQSGSIALNQVEIANNSGALEFDSCSFVVDRTLITGNTAGSRFSCTEGCSWNYLFNTYVTDNDVGASTPLLVLGDIIVEMSYVTIANNHGALSSAIACDTNPNHLVRMWDSAIFTSAQQPIECADISLKNTPVALFEDANDQAFSSYEGGVYRALPDSPFLKGTYSIYDLYIDYDGDPRPTNDADDYKGADLP